MFHRNNDDENTDYWCFGSRYPRSTRTTILTLFLPLFLWSSNLVHLSVSRTPPCYLLDVARRRSMYGRTTFLRVRYLEKREKSLSLSTAKEHATRGEKQTDGQWFLLRSSATFFIEGDSCRAKHPTALFDVFRRSPGTICRFTILDLFFLRWISLEETWSRRAGILVVGATREHATTNIVLSSGTVDPIASFCPVLRWLGSPVAELRGRRRWRRDRVWLVVPQAVYLQFTRYVSSCS